MICDLTLTRNPKTGAIEDETATLAVDYQPSEKVRARTAQVMRDFQRAHIVHNKPYAELNFMSVIQRLNQDRLSYNQFVEAPSEDPAEAWHSRAFRPIVRNKINTIAAYVSQQYIYPNIYAENENSEEDKDAAMVMRDLMTWRNEKAGYEKAFLHTIIDAQTDPAAFMGTEFNELYRDHKEIQEDGTWKVKKVLDEEFSGFHDEAIPCDEIWITDAYEPEIQRQPCIIRRRAFHYSTAKAKYSDNPLFGKYIKPGLQFLYSDEQQVFYKVYDSSLRYELVEEAIYWNRGADLKLRFLNGILMDDPDQPNPRKDKKYPMAKTGYEWINNRFFYYKSTAFKLANDEEIVNTAYRMLADASYLQGIPPAVQFGKEEIGGSVMVPGSITSIDNTDNPNAGFQTIQTNNNLGALTGLIERAEASISESSSNSVMAGNMPNARTPAFVMAAMQQNARTLLGLYEKMIGFLVKEFGELCIADVIQHLTVGEVEEIEGKESSMRYGKFLMPEQTVNGKSVSRMIHFDPSLPSEPISKQAHLKMSQDLAHQEIHQYDEKVQIIKVNPELFRKLKFKIVVKPEAIVPMSDAVRKSLLLEEYNLAMANPLTKKDAVTRDLLFGAYEHTKNDPDKYLMSAEEIQAQQAAQNPQPQPGEAQPLSKGLSDNLQMEQNPTKALSR